MPRILLLAVLLVSASGVVAAQETLTLDEALGRTLARNRSLQASRLAVEEAGARVDAVGSERFPRITVAESWQRGNQPVFVFSSLLSARQFAATNFAIDALTHPDAVGLFRTTVGVEQVLFDGGRTGTALTLARLTRDIADSAAAEAASETRVAVSRTYGRVLAAHAANRAADAGLEAAREDLMRTERRRDAGIATDADALSLSVHVANLQQRVIQAEGETAVARAELNHLMGAPLDQTFQVSEPPPAARATGAPLPLSTLVAEAAASRPELRRADAAVAAADAAHKGTRAALVPQLSAQAALDVSGTRVNDRAASWLVGGELRWTFSAGGAERARISGAATAAARARTEREDAQSRVRLDVLTALRRLEASRARQAVGLAAVMQARESQRIIRNRFDAGLTGITEVLRASTAVLDADADRTAALVDGIVSQALLDRAVGQAQSSVRNP